ncbi:MAG: endonuclease [Dehalococcoidales bacterium]|nr:endonuclease [Dehalococcoidales bacterium]
MADGLPALTLETVGQQLDNIYHRLIECYGHQHWWPAEEPFEVMVGAILTQSAAWRNVEKAISNLKVAGALSSRALRQRSLAEIADLIHPCGYYNVKARKLKSLVHWLQEYCDDDLSRLSDGATDRLRQQLLAVWGIGEETADSIILYAVGKPVFVIDAYTRRIIDRIGLAVDGNSYADYQSLFTENLPADAVLFNEYHALLICLGKNVCRPRPLCPQCCLREVCRFGSNS